MTPQPVIHVFGMDLPFSHVLLMVSLVGFFLLLIRWHFQPRAKNKFDLTDAFLDQRTNRASFEAIITACFAILAFWYVVTETLNGNKEVGGKLVDILMIFVIYRGAKQAINAYQDKPSAPTVVVPPAAGDNIAQQVIQGDAQPTNRAPDMPEPPAIVRRKPPKGE
jgi:cbb3-type cytochrome oxidase subunit 3